VASITASLKGSIKISSQSGNKKYEIDESKTFNFNEYIKKKIIILNNK